MKNPLNPQDDTREKLFNDFIINAKADCHKLKDLLTEIFLALDLLEDPEKDTSLDILQIIQNTSQRMANISNSLKTMSENLV